MSPGVLSPPRHMEEEMGPKATLNGRWLVPATRMLRCVEGALLTITVFPWGRHARQDAKCSAIMLALGPNGCGAKRCQNMFGDIVMHFFGAWCLVLNLCTGLYPKGADQSLLSQSKPKRPDSRHRTPVASP